MENRYEFQKNKLTIIACQSFIGNVQEAMDRWSFAVGIFFDLTKAYAVFDHNILFEKLDHNGIRGNINVCLKFYLTLHSQYEDITANDNKHCQFYTEEYETWNTSGVYFGPAPVLLYINDLPH
jgi:hypothetical protein